MIRTYSVNSVEAKLSRVGTRVDRALDRWIPSAKTVPSRLHEAIRYSLFGGGKRLRPYIALAACRAVGGAPAAAMPAACALEMIHTYSLIHDDLPAMDDDDFRRGRPSCHKAFDEATAILAGDALQAAAFGTLAKHAGPTAAAQARELALAAGSTGMVGGQQLDLDGSGRTSARDLERIHLAKTAAMFVAAARMGAIAGGAAKATVERLGRYGRDLGLAFQIVDDILDVTGTTEQLGKTAGKDAAQDKATYPALHGLEASRRHAGRLIGSAVRSVSPLGPDALDLVLLAEFILVRSH